MKECRGCGTALSKRSQKLYCGNACQGSVRRRALTKLWLESGQARIDGHQGHYIREYLADAQSGCCAICGGTGTWLGSDEDGAAVVMVTHDAVAARYGSRELHLVDGRPCAPDAVAPAVER